MSTVQSESAVGRPKAFEVDPTLDGVSFTRAFSSEFAKLLALRTTWWLSGATIALGLFLAGAVAFSLEFVQTMSESGPPEPAAVAGQGSAGVTFAMILLGALGAIAITTEFTSGAIRSSLTAVPKRSLLLGAKALALAVWTGLVSAVLILLSHLLVALIADPLPISAVVTDANVAVIYLTSWVAVVLTAVMGFGLGTLLRSSAGSIVTLAVILFVLQIVLSIIWGVSGQADWAETLMRMEYMYLVGEFTSQPGAQPGFGMESLERWQAGLGMLAWVGVPMVAGWLTFARRDS